MQAAAFEADVLRRVVVAFARATHLPATSILPSSHLAADLSLGKLDRWKLTIELEEAFATELPDEVVDRFFTVADIACYFSRHYFGPEVVDPVAEDGPGSSPFKLLVARVARSAAAQRSRMVGSRRAAHNYKS